MGENEKDQLKPVFLDICGRRFKISGTAKIELAARLDTADDHEHIILGAEVCEIDAELDKPCDWRPLASFTDGNSYFKDTVNGFIGISTFPGCSVEPDRGACPTMLLDTSGLRTIDYFSSDEWSIPVSQFGDHVDLDAPPAEALWVAATFSITISVDSRLHSLDRQLSYVVQERADAQKG